MTAGIIAMMAMRTGPYKSCKDCTRYNECDKSGEGKAIKCTWYVRK